METADVILMFTDSESQNTDSSPAPHLGPIELKHVPSVVQSSYVRSPSDQGILPLRTASGKPAEEKSFSSSLSFSELESGYHTASVKNDKTQPKNSRYPYRCSHVGSPCDGTSAGAVKDNISTTVQHTPQLPPSKDRVAEGDEHVCCWKKFIKMVRWAELVVFLCVTGLLIMSLTVHKLRKADIWELELWKWCVLALVIFLGRSVSELMIITLGFLTEANLWLKEKVLFYLYKLSYSVQVFIWLCLILLVWVLLICHGPKRSSHARKNLSYVTRALASCLVAAAIWLIKGLLIKLVDASFHFNASFKPIQEFIYHYYIIETLLENPLMEQKSSSKRLSFMEAIRGEKEEPHEVINAQMLKMMRQRQISAWNVRRLINTTICERRLDHTDQQIDICSKYEETAEKIINNVDKMGKGYIDEDDIVNCMETKNVAKEFITLVQGPHCNERIEKPMKTEDAAKEFITLVQGPHGNGRIYKPTLGNWLETVYCERKSHADTLNDGDAVIYDLNRLVSAMVLVVITMAGLLIMRLLTTQTLILISSQLVLVAFMFGNTARTVFEAIIFIFVTHPFDVRDRCVIDGVQLVVKKIDILTTTFVKYDGEKIFYPNSFLATKPISNFNRSDNMGDLVEFKVDLSVDSIAELKKEMQKYMKDKSDYWKDHSIVVKEIEDVNKLKIGLYVTHTKNFQNPGIRSSRRSELVLELKKIFEKIGIKYSLLPQEVQVSYAWSAVA